MKTFAYSACILLLTAWATNANAQGQPPEEHGPDGPHPGPMGQQGPGHPPPPEMHRRGPPPDHAPGPVDQWLDHVRRDNPEEYERLARLRATDPRAFREELRMRVRNRKFSRHLQRHPRMYRAYQALPAEEQDELAEELYGLKEPGKGRQGIQSVSPELQTLQEKTETLLEAYRTSRDSKDKKEVLAQLKTHLYRVFDERSNVRRQMIEKMEQRLAEVRRKIEKREANRDIIVERRLQELTKGENLEW